MSLVEVLVALVIMSIAFLAVLGGISTSATTADVHRAKTQADLVLKQYAEQVKGGPYQPCGAASPVDYAVPGFTHPDFTVVVSQVEVWQQDNPATFAPLGPSCVDTRLQKVTLTASDLRGRLGPQSMSVLKRGQ